MLGEVGFAERHDDVDEDEREAVHNQDDVPVHAAEKLLCVPDVEMKNLHCNK